MSVIVLGAGTAGYWATRELCRRPVAGGSWRRLVLVDLAVVKATSGVTCPAYRHRLGRPKAEVLRDLASRWSQSRVPASALVGDVRDLGWPDMLDGDAGVLNVVVVALDDWAARLAAVDDARRAAVKRRVDRLVFIQVGLDRGSAQVAVYGSRFEDACPACGLAALPQREPCVALTADGALVRGNLRGEARAAARLVRRIIADELGPAGRWVNIKSQLRAAADALGRRRYKTTSHVARRTPRCLGAHDPAPPVDLVAAAGAARPGRDDEADYLVHKEGAL